MGVGCGKGDYRIMHIYMVKQREEATEWKGMVGRREWLFLVRVASGEGAPRV
jgi:hypothetical protein